MIRGTELVCSEQVLKELFDEEKMVLLYRFSLEIEKAKNGLDLNLGLRVETDDHIVPTVGDERETRVQVGGGLPTSQVHPQAGRGDVRSRDVLFNTAQHFGMIVALHFLFHSFMN